MRANIIYLLMAAGVLVSCNNDTETGMAYLNGSTKTPIAVQTNLSAAPLTRAFDKTFEMNDKIFAYIEAGKMKDDNFDASASIFKWANFFTLGETIDNGGTPEGTGLITNTNSLSPTLYWDDFSSTEYDLREDGRGIRLKYGYCFNGGEDNATNNTSDEAKENGTLTWTVLSDQSVSGGSAMKQSDLLYAKTQDMITYGHNPDSRGTLTLPYTHAMSKITVNVTTGEGYDTGKANFASSVLTLKNMQIKADVDAPAATVRAVSPAGTDDIKAFSKSKENSTAIYQAIIGPTTFTAGDILAVLTKVGTSDTDFNDYNLPLTSGILSAWSAEDKMVVTEEVIEVGEAQAKPTTRAAIDGGMKYQTKPGIHYILNVTVDKQTIKLRATITDWESVEAEGCAQINFNPDVTSKGTIPAELKAKGFDVYKSSTDTEFTTKSSATFADGKWNYAPTLYWAGQSDDSYFRALSPAGASATQLSQGVDFLWGTSGDAAIAPRTGDVELTFKHLMSKLCIILETSSDEANKVDLTNAKIKITNLATTADYSIASGSISSVSDVVATMLNDKASGFTETVIPQTIPDDAKIIITLADGTTYSRQLNTCVLSNTETTIGEWTPGKTYTYTIHLEKEIQTFSAHIKDWESANGNGNATLEWD